MKRCLSLDEQIFINQFSQGYHSIEEMEIWFNSYNLQDKKDILHNLLNMVIQSHPTYQELETATELLKKSKSPAAVKLLNKNKPFEKYGYQICDLPENELLIGFKILLLTLSTADNRRKANEKPQECHHWWHKDLG